MSRAKAAANLPLYNTSPPYVIIVLSVRANFTFLYVSPSPSNCPVSGFMNNSLEISMYRWKKNKNVYAVEKGCEWRSERTSELTTHRKVVNGAQSEERKLLSSPPYGDRWWRRHETWSLFYTRRKFFSALWWITYLNSGSSSISFRFWSIFLATCSLIKTPRSHSSTEGISNSLQDTPPPNDW